MDTYHQTFVEPGTRDFLYGRDFQKVPGRQLVLLENGLCTYLTANDVGPNSIDQQGEQSFGQSSAAFSMDTFGPTDCNGRPAWVGPGEAYGISGDQDDHITIKYVNLKARLNCDLSIPEGWAIVVNLNETKEWDKQKAFRAATFSDFTYLEKLCNRKYDSVDEIKGKGTKSAGVGVKTPLNYLLARKEALSTGRSQLRLYGYILSGKTIC